MNASVLKIPESVLVVIYAINLEVLLLERADRSGFWQSVTGSKDSLSETPAETAKREVAEEIGCLIGSEAVPMQSLQDWNLSHEYEIFPHWRHRYPAGVTHNTEHVFSLWVPRDLPIVLSPKEHVQYRWLPWQEAANACFSPSNAQAIRELPVRHVR